MGILAAFFSNGKNLLTTLILVTVLGFVGYGVLKIKGVYNDLDKTKQQLSLAIETNKTMVEEIDKAKKINEDNSKVIKQLENDKLLVKASLQSLKIKLETSNKNFNDIKAKIDLGEPAKPVTPVIFNTLSEIERLRNEKLNNSNKEQK